MADFLNDEEKSIFLQISEFQRISEELDDHSLDEMLSIVIKLVSKPDVPAKIAAPLVVQLQALSFQFKMKGKYYMLYEKDAQGSRKKNLYLSASEGLKEIVDALKYLVKTF